MTHPWIIVIYFKKYPILKEVRDKCNREEKSKLDEAFNIIYREKLEIFKEKRNKSWQWALRKEYEKLHPEVKKENYLIEEKEEILKQEYKIE